MIEENKKLKMPHDLSMKDRKILKLSGVSDVGSFDDQMVVVTTDLGELHVQGKNLHVSKLNLANGEVDIDGLIVALVYSGDSKTNKGLLSKIFK